MGRVEDVGQDPAGGSAGGRGQSRRELEHTRAEIDPDDLVGALVPERQRVAAARALEVDRPPAAAVKVADQLHLDPEEVGPAGSDERDRLVEPAFVPFRRLVPGDAVGRVHGADVSELIRRRRTDDVASSAIHGA